MQILRHAAGMAVGMIYNYLIMIHCLLLPRNAIVHCRGGGSHSLRECENRKYLPGKTKEKQRDNRLRL
ncbi:hypothetical protein [Chitinophaga nivalis]|uniref:Secreted protein n=1 Tax=Chitinophaga nivalis TaxID=2991709 RepID=A0ABT3IE96_9BACT|nr:hypothetical protein [Chitinophaga nivalis]MCW3468018.1 hypothetical protein [Chitinophaga nivalis]MCW3482291.1 hypothetical protein [Chitinophaga nivalis]